MRNNNGTATFTNCDIHSNTATDGHGGGVAVYPGTATFVDCECYSNSAQFRPKHAAVLLPTCPALAGTHSPSTAGHISPYHNISPYYKNLG